MRRHIYALWFLSLFMMPMACKKEYSPAVPQPGPAATGIEGSFAPVPEESPASGPVSIQDDGIAMPVPPDEIAIRAKTASDPCYLSGDAGSDGVVVTRGFSGWGGGCEGSRWISKTADANVSFKGESWTVSRTFTVSGGTQARIVFKADDAVQVRVNGASVGGCGKVCFPACVSVLVPEGVLVSGNNTATFIVQDTEGGQIALSYSICVTAPPMALTLEASESEVAPAMTGHDSTTRLIARVTGPGGVPIPDVCVNFAAEAGGGGGHEHAGSRPKGTVDASCTTGTDGTCRVTYRASVVGGTEGVRAHLRDQTGIQASVLIRVRVPGLVDLASQVGPDGQPGFFHLTGATASHPVNHFVRSGGAASGLITAANEYHRKYAQSTRINDLSLPDGGLFDVHGDWAPPHRAHRKGTSVDVENNVVDGMSSYEELSKLREFMETNGWLYYPEDQNYYANFDYRGGD